MKVYDEDGFYLEIEKTTPGHVLVTLFDWEHYGTLEITVKEAREAFEKALEFLNDAR